MNLRELQKLLKNCTEADINFDEPHISLRCQENNLTKEKVVYILLHETERLYNFIEDRSRVYKLYFKLTNKRQLDVIIDLFTPKKLMIRNIKILDSRKNKINKEEETLTINKRFRNMVDYYYNYSEYSDILNIHKKNVLTKGSAELGDFTVDFGNDNDIVGIEIEHASEFFNNLDISKEFLKDLEDAKMVIDKRNNNCQIVFIVLKTHNDIKKIPLPTTIAS